MSGAALSPRKPAWEFIMRSQPIDRTVQMFKGKLKDLVGLPAGDKTPYGEGTAPKTETTPEGGLTSPDAEGLSPHGGTGIKPE